MKTEIQLLIREDLSQLKALIAVFENVFEMQNFKLPNDSHLIKLLNKDDFLAVVAKVDNTIIGGLTVYLLDQYYSEKPLAYIYDLAVLQEYQRKGVGRKLIEFINEYGRQHGFEEVYVQAENVDQHAIDFYRTTKPTAEEQVVHFTYDLVNAQPKA